MTQTETCETNRRRRQLHAGFNDLAEQCERLTSDFRSVAMRAVEVVEGAPPASLGQAAVMVGGEAAQNLKQTKRLWDELLDLKRAALGGRETP